ncbi:MAG: hypothetical protein PHX93_02190 [Candidatus Peribacteraceae bacterium]|nr:hypothetical protein [Candidatus Peribacteraceae bacterium]
MPPIVRKSTRTGRATSSTDDRGITPAVFLDHMRGMEQRLMREIGGIRADLTKVDSRLTSRMDRMENDIAWIKVSVGNIDKRLDDLEVVQVPKLKRIVGIR